MAFPSKQKAPQSLDYPPEDAAPKVKKYGAIWLPVWSREATPENPVACSAEDWEIEMICCRRAKDAPGPQIFGKAFSDQKVFAYHFRRLASAIFNPNSDTNWKFEWNPNAKTILRCFLEYRKLGILGPASSSKTRTLALIAVLLFLIYGEAVKILVTSTTEKAAKAKIWGEIQLAWQALARFLGGEDRLAGKFLSGDSIIRFQVRDETGNFRYNPRAGLQLVPSDKNTENSAAEKIQGIKGPLDYGFLVILADELDTLGEGIFKVMKGNLEANAFSRFAGAFNPTSRHSYAGQFVTPLGGWKPKGHPEELNEENAREWECENEVHALRLDGRKSPNLKKDGRRWIGLLDALGIRKIAANEGGEDSPGFWRNVIAWFCPDKTSSGVYSEEELINYGSTLKETQWCSPPQLVAGIDVGRNHGGDACIMVILRVGPAQRNVIDGEKLFDPKTYTGTIRMVERTVAEVMDVMPLDRNMRLDKSKEEQLVARIINILDMPKYNGSDGTCRALKIENIAFDVTGGAQVVPLVARDIPGTAIHINFKSSASDKYISLSDNRKGSDVFANKRAQMWWCRELVRCQQIRNLPSIIMGQMCEVQQKKTTNGRIQLEDKEELAKRIGKSPDEADAFFLAIEVAREKFGLTSQEHAIRKPKEGYEVIEKSDPMGRPVFLEVKKANPDPLGERMKPQPYNVITYTPEPLQFMELPYSGGGTWGSK